MPYIESYLREPLNEGAKPKSPGALNYILTKTILDYLDQKTSSYQDLNEIIGVLESVKLEFYRRKVSPYEDSKIQQNGDVY